jgi:ankyrin repeat protein
VFLDYHWTPLHLAAFWGNAEICEALIAAGAQVNARDERRQTPLFYAARNNRKEVVALLLSHGAQAYSDGKDSSTLLAAYLEASGTGNDDIVKLLLAHGAHLTPYEQNAVNESLCSAFSLDEAEKAIRIGAQPDGLVNLSPVLFCAASSRSPALVEFLINAGANPNKRDQNGWTALHAAVDLDRRDSKVESRACILVLIKKGADPNARDEKGHTPLWVAAYDRRPDLMECLLQNGADPNPKDTTGLTLYRELVDSDLRDEADLIHKYETLNRK